MSLIVNDKYKLKKKIGQGSFGQVYNAIDKTTKKSFAVKLENSDCGRPHLKKEMQIYRLINKCDKCVGIPKIFWYGKYDIYNAMVTEKLGQSLQQLFEKNGNVFSLKTVLMIAVQILDRMELLHKNSIIHRDIKPSNFVIGRKSKKNLVYVIDFGLSKQFINTSTQQHIQFSTGKSLVGTARYVSINTHLGIEQSRRDDLESVGYMLIFFLKGQLPWQNIKTSDKTERYILIKKSKLETSLSELCDGLPKEFKLFIKYAKNLTFTDTPNYLYLKNLFLGLMAEKGYGFDFVYDWS